MDAEYGPGLTKSSPIRAVQSVFESPEWVTNLLWLSIATLLQSVFVGQIALFGYGSELLEKRAGRPGAPPADIDSNRIGDYLTKGIWPFLVQFVAQLMVGLVISVPLIIVAVLVAVVAGNAGGEDAVVGMMFFLVMPLAMILSILSMLFVIPLLIRAMICQDFKNAFDLGWCMDFYKLMFWELLGSSIIMGLLSMVITLVGLALCFVGYIPAVGVVWGAMMHLTAQWYEVYLNRGGTPVEPPEPIVDAAIV